MTIPLTQEKTETNPVIDHAFSEHNLRGIQLARATIGMMVLFSLINLVIGLTISPSWRLYFLAGVFALGAILALTSLQVITHGRTQAGMILLMATTQMALILESSMIAGIGFPSAAYIIFVTIIEGSSTLDEKMSDRALIVGVVTGFIALCVNTFQSSIINTDRLPSMPLLVIFELNLAILFITFVVLVLRRFIVFTIQLKLLTALLLLTLVPMRIITQVSTQNTSRLLTAQANEALVNAAKQTASILDTYFSKTQSLISSNATNKDFTDYFNLPGLQRANSAEEKTAQSALNKLKDNTTNAISFALLDPGGKVIASTDYSEIGADMSKRDFIQATKTTQNGGISTIEFERKTNQASYFVTAPVLDNRDQLKGILSARLDAITFYQTLLQNENAVQSGSYPILFDDNLLRLADPLNPQDMFKTAVPLSAQRISALQANFQLPASPAKDLATNLKSFAQFLSGGRDQSNFAIDVFNNGNIFMGAIAPLNAQSWKVVYIQNQSVILAPVAVQGRLTILYMALIALITAIIDLRFANLLSRPIRTLTKTANQIAGGDLSARALVTSQDEVESLAVAFNFMTSQLRSSIEGLEGRVQERTRELANQTQKIGFRVTQLQTLSDVARAIASEQDFEQLLTLVTHMTSERFDFYHVGIFLLDDAKEFAVLRAANSEGGQKMLARQHQLKVGQTGIVGYVAGSGKARIATDVGEDSVYFSNPDLPLTRSEMALPLKSGDEVIGILDVQSTVANAFTEDDVSLFSTLADQVAIVIINNRLYHETRQALAEAQATHRRYLRQEWDQVVFEQDTPGYQMVNHELQHSSNQVVPEMEEAILKGEVCSTRPNISSNRKKSPETSTLAVPIKLRGEVIGVIGLQETDSHRQWYQEEIDMVQSVAEQVAFALENARLFEQTIRRAERERKVLDISSKIRSSNDPQTMLKTAITELQHALRASRAQVLLSPVIDTAGSGEEDAAGLGS